MFNKIYVNPNVNFQISLMEILHNFIFQLTKENILLQKKKHLLEITRKI